MSKEDAIRVEGKVLEASYQSLLKVPTLDFSHFAAERFYASQDSSAASGYIGSINVDHAGKQLRLHQVNCLYLL